MNEFNVKDIKVIIGLGNPGAKYVNNRHNIGFKIVDKFAEKYDASWKDKDFASYSEIQAFASEVNQMSAYKQDEETRIMSNRPVDFDDILDQLAKREPELFPMDKVKQNPLTDSFIQKLLLVKPKTFMNSSGKVLPFILKKGIKVTEILIIHDDLEKDFGKFGLKFGGSARGHNGLRSIISEVGDCFWRLRFGIGRPEEKSDVARYVLSDFSNDEIKSLPGLIDGVINLII